ncbi:MAG: hypothetical protein GY938_07700, partial [Ketobacter sp.]|nr:hypothetical protein [Ketobacter sp.]
KPLTPKKEIDFPDLDLELNDGHPSEHNSDNNSDKHMLSPPPIKERSYSDSREGGYIEFEPKEVEYLYNERRHAQNKNWYGINPSMLKADAELIGRRLSTKCHINPNDMKRLAKEHASNNDALIYFCPDNLDNLGQHSQYTTPEFGLFGDMYKQTRTPFTHHNKRKQQQCLDFNRLVNIVKANLYQAEVIPEPLTIYNVNKLGNRRTHCIAAN